MPAWFELDHEQGPVCDLEQSPYQNLAVKHCCLEKCMAQVMLPVAENTTFWTSTSVDDMVSDTQL
jgi:hypothetical protein